MRAYSAPTAASFCSLGHGLDCTSVALSRYSVLLGLPVPLWGALGFGALAIAAWLRSWWLLPLAGIAAVASVVLLVVELAFIGALCLLCEGVHLAAIALFVVAWRERRELRQRTRDDSALVFLPPLGVMLGLLFFVTPYWGSFGWRGPTPFPEGVTEDGAHWIGAREPKLTLDEYTDYLCPHCRAATAWTLRRLAARPNAIRIVRRQFPLSACNADRKGSCLQVRMAHCAAEQQRFWQMDRWLFAHGDERVPDVRAAAHDLDIDVERFATCTERRDIYERAEAESRSVAKRHLLGTPTYMVRGKRITPSQADNLLARGSAE